MSNATKFLTAISSVYNKYKIRDSARASLQRHLSKISYIRSGSDMSSEIAKLERKIEEVIAIEKELMKYGKSESIALHDMGSKIKEMENIVISRLPQGKARKKRVRELEGKIKKKAAIKKDSLEQIEKRLEQIREN